MLNMLVLAFRTMSLRIPCSAPKSSQASCLVINSVILPVTGLFNKYLVHCVGTVGRPTTAFVQSFRRR